MNPNNYATWETSKRLVDAGIVLETECCWQWKDPCSPDDIAYGAYGEWILVRGSIDHIDAECIPAPSMAEVWRELPPQGCYLTANQGYYYAWIEWTDFEGHGKSCEAKENTNPADALIDLLIWVRKEASNDHT